MKKSPLLCLVLALLLVCSVSVAFAAAPMEPAPDPEPAVTEPAENAEPALVEEELHDQIEERMLEDALILLARELGCVETDIAMQSDCKHLNLRDGGRSVIWNPENDFTHLKIDATYKTCLDCGAPVIVDYKKTLENHNFGADSYVGSNHASPDPSNHTFTYSHTCLDCSKTVQYTVSSGCRKGNCVDPYSLTPEPEIASVLP